MEILTTTDLQHISCAIVMTITSQQRKVQGLLNSFILRSDKIGVENLAKSRVDMANADKNKRMRNW